MKGVWKQCVFVRTRQRVEIVVLLLKELGLFSTPSSANFDRLLAEIGAIFREVREDRRSGIGCDSTCTNTTKTKPLVCYKPGAHVRGHRDGNQEK